MSVTAEFCAARDLLVSRQQNLDKAREEFQWPRFEHFNFALDWFDQIAASPERADQDAVVIVEEDGTQLRRSFAELSESSHRVARWFTDAGLRRGDRIILMLDNQVELWEIMLAAIRIGAVLVPTTTQMGPLDLQDRVERAEARWAVGGPDVIRKFAEVPGDFTLIIVPEGHSEDADDAAGGDSGEAADVGDADPAGAGDDSAGAADTVGAGTGGDGAGEAADVGDADPAESGDPVGSGESADPAGVGRTVLNYLDAASAAAELAEQPLTAADETLLLYFTSGTTSKPKLVEHTHVSYPVGHLSTLYWIGLEPGDVHLNVSSPGWAKHAWSNFFAPWIAEATIFIYNFTKFDPQGLMNVMDNAGVTSFCAPPTVWRMLIKADLGQLKNPPAKTISAGEPLNPEVIEQVQASWGCTIRDGFGQTETTLQVANTPGRKITMGAMGLPLPGYDVVLIDPVTGKQADEGEMCVRLGSTPEQRPVGLMKGYYGDPEKNAEVFRDGFYHTGDIASRDERGVFTYVGRADDVFKSSDYKISPFELESVLVEHPAVMEAAVVPTPDELRLSVPKAYVTLSSSWDATEETATAILQYCLDRLPPYKRIRRIEFAQLPKTISGKIRRVQLRNAENQRAAGVDRVEAAGEGADRAEAVGAPDGAAGARGDVVEFREENLPNLKRASRG